MNATHAHDWFRNYHTNNPDEDTWTCTICRVTTSESPILCAAHTDPYILEQAYEQDEEGLEEGIVICPKCGVVIVMPDVFTGSFIICDTCLHEWPYTQPQDARLNDEPTAAGEVTGYDNGPTFW
jgi:hypothetical protein